MDQMDRAGDLKGELADFGLSPRFSRALSELILTSFPDGEIEDEGMFSIVVDDFLFNHRLVGGDLVVERFIANRDDLSEEDKSLMLGWRDNVQGVYEIGESHGDDGVVAFNHIDELTYRIRSNMGPEGVKDLTPGMIMIGRIVPVCDDWMISGVPRAYPADQAEQVLAGLPRLVLGSPKAVFRNPEKLARARELQAEQRQAFIDLHGSDLIVVPGAEVRATLMAFYRHVYEQAGSKAGPWTEPDLPPLPEAWTEADSVALIYDAEDGLGFYADFAAAREVFANPALVVQQRYREVITGYLRDEGVSPIPFRRLADAAPERAGLVFQKLLKKPGFSWERDGEALLRKHKVDWYAEPPLPRVIPTSPASTRLFHPAGKS